MKLWGRFGPINLLWSFIVVGIVKHNKKARGSRPQAPKSAVEEVEIHALSHEAQGVSRSQDKVMFIPGTLPGETVKVQVDKEMRHFNHGKLIELVSVSNERVEPFCPHFKRCGACQLQHLASDKQLGYKQQNLHEQLTRQLKLNDIPWQAPIESEPFNYRRRARLGVRYRKQQDEIIVGFREEANKHLAAIKACPVLQPSLSELITPLQVLISQLVSKSRITQLELIASDDTDVAVLRHLKKMEAQDVKKLKKWAQAKNIQLFLQGDEDEGLTCLWPEEAAPLSYEVQGNDLHFNVKNFIQGNKEVNKKMLAQAQNWLAAKPHETLLDLFAGIGNFSVPMAQQFKQVVAVEGISDMVKQIDHNSALNKQDNVQAMMLNLADEVLLQKLPKTDAILLDPPRTGAAELMPWLSRQKSRILYVACEPSSLVRDAKVLLEAGFKLDKICVMDMFPQTKHVESMALFVKDSGHRVRKGLGEV